jgi:hypothetical protein
MNDLANYLSFLWFLLSNVIPYTVRELVSIAIEYPLLFIIPIAFIIAIYIATRIIFRMIRFVAAVSALSFCLVFVIRRFVF